MQYKYFSAVIIMVGMTGFEPATSCSQSRRATNCATSRYLICFCVKQFLKNQSNVFSCSCPRASLASLSPSCCHSFFLASSAPGGARKRLLLRYPKFFVHRERLAKFRPLPLLFPRFIRPRRRSETSPTALHPDI